MVDVQQTREVAWRGLDDPTRIDVISVEFLKPGGLVATGIQSTEEYRATWDLIVDDAWHTKLLTVDVEEVRSEGSSATGSLWQRHLNLWRRTGSSGDSEWRAEGGESGNVPERFGEIGFTDGAPTDLATAVDIDLAGCPLTNVMPLRRSGLADGHAGEFPITAAWVSLPDLAVRPATQIYSQSAEGLGAIASALDDEVTTVVHYESQTRNVSVDLSLDADGLVVTYPDLATRTSVD